MESRLLVATVVVVLAVLAARWLERRRPAGPSAGTYPVPARVDRADFPRPDAPYLVVLFSSRACDGCVPVAARVADLESAGVATCEVEAAERRDLHRRYGVEGVPTVVVADAEGVVRAGFVGAVEHGELRRALAEAGATL